MEFLFWIFFPVVVYHRVLKIPCDKPYHNVIKECWIHPVINSVLYSRTLLLTRSVYDSSHLLAPDYQSSPPLPRPRQHSRVTWLRPRVKATRGWFFTGLGGLHGRASLTILHGFVCLTLTLFPGEPLLLVLMEISSFSLVPWLWDKNWSIYSPSFISFLEKIVMPLSFHL